MSLAKRITLVLATAGYTSLLWTAFLVDPEFAAFPWVMLLASTVALVASAGKWIMDHWEDTE